jgi:hypothetical protein
MASHTNSYSTDYYSDWFKVRFPNSWQGIFDKDCDSIDRFDACKYYDVNDLTHNTALINDISIIHINIRSIKVNFDALVHLLENVSYCFDVIAIIETWLDDSSSQLYKIKGYNMYSYSRDYGRGGGICFYVKDIYVVTTVSSNIPLCNTFEHAQLIISHGVLFIDLQMDLLMIF